ncbi:MAG TPA: carboxyl transferase domain-containing protein, partial [Alphaproteobacteria bacterium]|nr:carboxyl transferase domain-containing protein [Alphaproteobacteria bacterium]
MSAKPTVSRDDFKRELDEEFERRSVQALAMGGPGKLAKRAKAGLLDARSRVDRLFDPGTFTESGLFTTSIHSPEDAERSPCDGKITGYGRIQGRWAAAVSNDFTVFGASSGATNVRKIAHMKRVATQRGMPMVFLGES